MDARSTDISSRSLPEVAGVIFSGSAPVPKFLKPDPGPESLKIGESDSCSNSATIDPTRICPCFYLRKDHADSYYCRNWKVTPAPDFHKFSTSDPGPKKNVESCGVDSGTPDPWPPLKSTASFVGP